MYFLSQKNILQFSCITCLLFTTVAIVLAKLSPASGYESSIYKSTPIFIWIAVALLIISGLMITIIHTYDENLGLGRLWGVGLFFIFFSYVICLSLYIIRGYYMWCMNGDPATHISYINQIISTGHIPSQLFYPILHIYTSQIYLISNISIISLHKMLPLIFGILYIPFIYILSKSVFPEKNMAILSTVAGSTLVNGFYFSFTPNNLSNLYFPLLLLIFFKVISTKDTRWEILILIMAFLYPIFHQVPTLIFFILISTFFLPFYLLSKNNLKITLNKNENFFRLKLTLLFLLFAWSVTWISSFYIWEVTIKNLNTLAHEGGFTQISALVGNINHANESGYNIIEHGLISFGGPLIYVLMTLISFQIIWKDKDRKEFKNLVPFFGPFLFVCLLIIVLYPLNLNFDPLRAVTYTTMISTLFIGYFLSYLINKIKRERKKAYIFSFIGLVFLFLIVWFNAILTSYPSPYTLKENYQTTQSEVDGMSWFFENRNLDIEITGITVAPYRFGDFLLTPEQKKLQKLRSINPDYLSVPYHFGYDNKSSLSSHYKRTLYMGINEKDKLIYKDTLPEIAEIRWVPNDFEKLDEDRSLKKIYSSEKFELFYINVL